MPKLTKIPLPYRNRNLLIESKGEVIQNLVTFPKELGEAHPFDFKVLEDTYKRIGLAKSAVDKHVDFMVSPGFFITSDDKKAETIINDFIRKVGFDHILRTWIQEALIKGNGFIEIGVSGTGEVDLKVINANHMFVNRNTKGEVKGYNQFIGKDFKRMDRNKDIIPFLPPEIAHLKINSVSDGAYGFGMLFSALIMLDNMASAEKDMHLLMRRKSNSPIQAKLGSKEEPASQGDVDNLGARLEYLNNQHEWATDHRVEFNVIDFGNIGDKFTTILEHDRDMLFFIFQIPAVIMGMARIPEGLAQVQLDTFERRIQSLQAGAERVIEEQIFRPILNLNGLDSHVELHWGQASQQNRNDRVQALAELLKIPFMSPELRSFIELDIAENLSFDDADKVLVKPDEAMKREREREETEIEQPEVPGEKEEKTEVELLESTMKLNEWLNFDYQQYQKEVLKFIATDRFLDLLARDTKEVALGKLTQAQLRKVRSALRKGFEDNSTLVQIAADIDKIGLGERVRITSEGKKVISSTAENRGIIIARTESTRVAAEGVLNNYNNKKIQEVVWLASVSERTCPICLENNGKIFNLNEARGEIPAHAMCRCAWLPFTE